MLHDLPPVGAARPFAPWPSRLPRLARLATAQLRNTASLSTHESEASPAVDKLPISSLRPSGLMCWHPFSALPLTSCPGPGNFPKHQTGPSSVTCVTLGMKCCVSVSARSAPIRAQCEPSSESESDRLRDKALCRELVSTTAHLCQQHNHSQHHLILPLSPTRNLNLNTMADHPNRGKGSDPWTAQHDVSPPSRLRSCLAVVR